MASGESCLYTLIHAPDERHDEILRELVMPAVSEVRDHPKLESLFFARYNNPDWQLRFRVLGAEDWVQGAVREMIERRLASLERRGLVSSHEHAEYQRETERYGGPEGMRLSEQIFMHDTVACLDLIDAEARGRFAKTRREYTLLMTERFLDLFGFSREQRTAFYEYAYSWTVRFGEWREEDELEILEQRYRTLKPGLADLFGEQSRDPEIQWGGAAPARIAQSCLAASRPVIARIRDGHAAGRITQDLGNLAWSLTHMHCNRLGVDTTAEAILRFFMHRLHQDEAVPV